MNSKCTGPLAIQSLPSENVTFRTHHVLRKRHGKEQSNSRINKVPNSIRIIIIIPARESQIRSIKEGKQPPLLDNLQDPLPIIPRRINPRRIVRTRMQQNDTPFLCSPQIRQHPLDVQSNRLGVVVAILLDFEVARVKNTIVVGPRGRRDVDCLFMPKAFQKVAADAEATGPRERLDGCDAVGLDGCAVVAKGETGD
jgi:hypothetical protein